MVVESAKLWQVRLLGLTPAALSLVAVLLAAVPFGLPFFGPVVPGFAVMSVFYWSIFRPELMPGWAAFILGLVQDALTGVPFGATSIILVLVQGICLSQRKVFVGKSFAIGWWGFVLMAGGAATVSWAIASLYALHLYDPRPVVVQFVLTVSIYPAVAWFFGRVEIAVLRRAG